MKKDNVKIGNVYNFLTVAGEPYSVKTGRYTKWLVKCICKCGKSIDVVIASILSGSTKSCGCYNRLAASNRMSVYNDKTSHGLLKHPLYNSWKTMKRKCNNIKAHDYLGGGIHIYPEWINSVSAFYIWGINNGWREGYALSRIDEKLDFTPNNCYFRSKADIIKGNLNMEKTRATCLKRYGSISPMQNPIVLAKQRKSFVTKYGRPFGFFTTNKEQKSIGLYLSSLGYDFHSIWLDNSKEVDLYNENTKLGIEYCGIYWHNECSRSPRGNKYHYDKYMQCKSQDIRLITIFSDEWLTRTEQVKNYLKSTLGVIDNRIYGRECDIEIISPSIGNQFINNNHIQQQNKLASVYFGLFNQKILIGVMSLAKHHRVNTIDSLVLDRMCFSGGYQIIGGASKLLSHAIKWCKLHDIHRIITWSDNRWSTGNVYNQIGFKLECELPPDYSYVKIAGPKERIPKQRMTKSKIKCPDGLTESEYCKQLGYARIWDCGKTRYVYEIKQ